ncbi:MAG TPA: hypothetical protein VMD53_17960 [Rhizomicrobium sp.]|nr:hypothetical protein [Rhizomicrobium sp.]
MSGKYFAVALAAIAAFLTLASQANADILSLECQDFLVASPNSFLTMRIWINLDNSMAVTAFNLVGGPGSSLFTYAGPDPVSISPQQFFVQNRQITIDRLSGGGNEGSNRLKSCTKVDLPYPPEAPSLTQKF